jgi:hypothetical protein
VTWENCGPHSAEPSIPDKDEADWFKSSQAHYTGVDLTLCGSGPRPLLSPTA